MRVVTSVTIFTDSVGMRMSATYSEVDEDTGKITSDNKRIDRVVTGETAKAAGENLIEYAQEFVGSLEG